MKKNERLIYATAVLLGLSLTLVAPAHSQDGRLREMIKRRWEAKLKNDSPPKLSTDPLAKILQPGDYAYSIIHNGRNRLYRIHVPSKYQPGRAAPLLVALHGGGGNMDYQANDHYYGLISKSDHDGFIVVFPNGFSKFRSGKFATWNAGKCCGGARDENIDDVGFIKRVVENVTQQLTVDKNKIFATGMSNGGMMTQRLACDLSDVFKAIAPVAGTDNTKSCNPKFPISILEIHAKNDDHVLYNGGAGPGVGDVSKVTQFTSVPETISRWVKRNVCTPIPKRVLEKPGAYCDLYSGCKQGVLVKLCITDTGGHSWPGGIKPRGEEAASKAISADDVMWEFFSHVGAGLAQ